MATEFATIQSAVKPIATAAPDSKTAKRKIKVSEIEVDLSLPEPPSKRTRRALKKGKNPVQKTSRRPHGGSDDADLREEETSPPPHESENKSGKQADSPRSDHGVWIGNLPFTVTAPDLRTWLVGHSGGVILDESITRLHLPLSKNRDGKPNKGFAYVDFNDLAPKVAAMALSENDLHGRRLLIKDAKSFEGRPDKAKAEDGQDGGGANKPGDGKAAKDSESRKVFVGNLSFETSEDDVWGHFAKCGEIDWVKIATFEDSGKCKGYGWVKFREPEGAKWAVQGFVKIQEAVETEEDFAADNDVDVKGNDAEDNDADGAEVNKPKTKMRKWWVNRLKGRELKIELAEDDQVRYRRRFGKDAKGRAEGSRGGGISSGAHKPSQSGQSEK